MSSQDKKKTMTGWTEMGYAFKFKRSMCELTIPKIYKTKQDLIFWQGNSKYSPSPIKVRITIEEIK